MYSCIVSSEGTVPEVKKLMASCLPKQMISIAGL